MIHLFLRNAIAANPDPEKSLDAFDAFWAAIEKLPAAEREGHHRALARAFFDFRYTSTRKSVSQEVGSPVARRTSEQIRADAAKEFEVKKNEILTNAAPALGAKLGEAIIERIYNWPMPNGKKLRDGEGAA